MVEYKLILENIPPNIAAIGLTLTALITYLVKIREDSLKEFNKYLDRVPKDNRSDFLRDVEMLAHDDGEGPLKPPQDSLRVIIPTWESPVGVKSGSKTVFVSENQLEILSKVSD